MGRFPGRACSDANFLEARGALSAAGFTVFPRFVASQLLIVYPSSRSRAGASGLRATGADELVFGHKTQPPRVRALIYFIPMPTTISRQGEHLLPVYLGPSAHQNVQNLSHPSAVVQCAQVPDFMENWSAISRDSESWVL